MIAYNIIKWLQLQLWENDKFSCNVLPKATSGMTYTSNNVSFTVEKMKNGF